MCEIWEAAMEEVREMERADVRKESFESAAKIAEEYGEWLKATYHRDGIGMGWQEGEELCHMIAERIREFKDRIK